MSVHSHLLAILFKEIEELLVSCDVGNTQFLCEGSIDNVVVVTLLTTGDWLAPQPNGITTPRVWSDA